MHAYASALHTVKGAMQACLDLDYDASLKIREAPWPTLRVALAIDPPLPWDILFALALVDATDDCGDSLWNAYAVSILPPAERIPLPCLQTRAALRELQDRRFETVAMQQAEGLEAVRNRIALEAATQGVPGVDITQEELQWGYACVRSRSFVLTDTHFTQVRRRRGSLHQLASARAHQFAI
jgi:heme exporter protein D